MGPGMTLFHFSSISFPNLGPGKLKEWGGWDASSVPSARKGSRGRGPWVGWEDRVGAGSGAGSPPAGLETHQVARSPRAARAPSASGAPGASRAPSANRSSSANRAARSRNVVIMIVFFALRWLLGVFFMIVGTVKLSQCSLSAEVYQQMKVQHEHLTSLFPEHFLGYKLSPANLLILVGWMELTGGFLLALGNPLLQGLSNIVLIFLMMGIFYSLLISKESLIAYAPVTLCLGLLLLLNTRFCYR